MFSIIGKEIGTEIDPFANQDAKLLKVNRKINAMPKNIEETIPFFDHSSPEKANSEQGCNLESCKIHTSLCSVLPGRMPARKNGSTFSSISYLYWLIWLRQCVPCCWAGSLANFSVRIRIVKTGVDVYRCLLGNRINTVGVSWTGAYHGA